MKHIDNNSFLKTALYEGNFGIEVEEHRVNQYNCHLSQVPHAAGLGTRKGHPFFQTDFAESQEELVTSPHESVSACLDHLHCLQSILQDNLDENDMIWPLSMPPKLNADDLDYLATGFKARPWYQKYLEKMLEKYGPFYGLMSGVHVSYSPSAEILTWYKSEYGYSTQAEANNQMLFKTVQHILGYRWLLTYLFGASPLSENIDDTIPEKARQLQPVRSFRSSQYGFNNLDNFKTDYSSINAFTAQLNHFMTTGRLVSLSDFHGPARMKGFETLEELQNKGATFIELRIFDLNPFSNNGIDKLTLNFLHLLIMDSIINPKNWCADSLSKAEITNDTISLQHPNQPLPDNLTLSATQLFERLSNIVDEAPTDIQTDLHNALDYAKLATKNPDQTVNAKLARVIKNGTLTEFAVQRGQEIKNAYQTETTYEKYNTIPKQLHKAYQLSQTMGFKTKLTENQLSVTINNETYSFHNDTTFTQTLSYNPINGNDAKKKLTK